MLREVTAVRQNEAEVLKRWFESDFFDLYLWWRGGRWVHMQLCYNRHRPNESAISWKEGVGMFHDGVDALHRARTPLLATRGEFDAEKVNARFLQESASLPLEVRKFVLHKLHEFALSGPIKRNRPPRAAVRRDGWQREPTSG